MKGLFRGFLAAVALCASSLSAQTVPCPTQPGPVAVRQTDTTFSISRDFAISKAGACLGTSTYILTASNLKRYEVDWAPCPASVDWRKGAQFTTLASALVAARKPPVCPALPPPTDTMFSATASTLVVSADSMLLGGSVTAIAVPRNASGKPLGVGRTVLVGPNGGTGAVTVGAVTYAAGDSSYRATVTGSTAGVTMLYAGIGTTPFAQSQPLRVIAPVIVPPPVDTTPVPPPVGGVRPQVLDQSWGTCGVGNTCPFSGLRDVRLIGTAGSSLVTNVRGVIGIDCAGYAFPNGYNLGTLQRCEFGPLKTVAIANPMPGMNNFGPTILVPAGDPGSTTPQSTFTSFNGNPVQDGLGATRMKCELNRFAFDDPIVYPGQPGKSHLHMLFGNTYTPFSGLTSQNIRSGTIASTCQGGTLNASAYWVPALYDTLTMEIILPRFGQFYYKSGYGVDISATQTIPAGLVIIAGDKNGTPANPSTAGEWACGQANVSHVIPPCAAGRPYLEMAVTFPSCWNGRDLDSPNHASHMAYTVLTANGAVCPSTHPVLIPKIDLLFDFDLTPTSHPERWRLVSDMYSGGPGGASAHADYMIGWDPATMSTLVTQCLNKGLDCGVGSVGSNIQLLFRP